MKKGLSVLSLCDGMACGFIALEKLGVPVKEYYASEIKPIAIQLSSHNFKNIVHIGDVRNVKYSNGVLHTQNGDYKTNIDIVMFGSPCQSVSRAMKKDKRIGLKDMDKSGIFYECYRVLKEVSPKWFFMENVIMNKEEMDIITNLMGVEPIKLNSSLLTGQNRARLYWTNIPNMGVPTTDSNVNVNDILDNGYIPYNKARTLMKNDSHGFYDDNGMSYSRPNRFHRSNNLSFGNLVYKDKKSYERMVNKSNEILNGRKPKAEYYDNVPDEDFKDFRYLNKNERARLQGVPEKYVDSLSEKDAADLLGDGWNIDTVAYLLKGLKNENYKNTNRKIIISESQLHKIIRKCINEAILML